MGLRKWVKISGVRKWVKKVGFESGLRKWVKISGVRKWVKNLVYQYIMRLCVCAQKKSILDFFSFLFFLVYFASIKNTFYVVHMWLKLIRKAHCTCPTWLQQHKASYGVINNQINNGFVITASLLDDIVCSYLARYVCVLRNIMSESKEICFLCVFIKTYSSHNTVGRGFNLVFISLVLCVCVCPWTPPIWFDSSGWNCVWTLRTTQGRF